jgi:hypothetical protein
MCNKSSRRSSRRSSIKKFKKKLFHRYPMWPTPKALNPRLPSNAGPTTTQLPEKRSLSVDDGQQQYKCRSWE